ncbi:hypothetical protein HG530_000537 [Fusarium avenaceum]|nr:hypothetical protein HG530_000537 [Fusarium avenaceum]
MNLANKLVATNLGKDYSPDEPVEGTSHQNTDTNNTVDVVWHALVLVLAGIIRSDERSNHQIHVAEHEKDSDRETGLDRRVPVVLGAVKVQVDKATSNKGVDNGKRVRDEVEDEVVSITGRRSQDDNDTDNPVLKETGERGVEGSVAGPQTRERQSDKDRHGALSSRAHNVAEQRGGDKTLRSNDLSLGDGSKVGNVDEDVDDRDRDDGSGSSNLEGSHRVAGLAEGVVGVAITDETPDDVVQSSDNTVGASSGALKGVAQVVGLLIDLEVSTEGDESADDHDEDNGQLDESESVLQTKTPLESASVDEERSGDTGQTNSSLVPSIDFLVGSVEDVLAKDDRVTRRPTHQENVRSVHASDEEPGLAVDELEVVLLTTVLGDTGSPFEVDGSTSSGNDGSNNPDDEGQTRTSKKSEDGARSGKDTGSNDTVEDEHRGTQNANLALSIGGMLKTTWSS